MLQGKHEAEMAALAGEFQKSIADMRASFAAAAGDAAAVADQTKLSHQKELKRVKGEHAKSRESLSASHTAAVKGHEATVAALREEHTKAATRAQIVLETAQVPLLPLRPAPLPLPRLFSAPAPLPSAPRASAPRGRSGIVPGLAPRGVSTPQTATMPPLQCNA